MAGLQAFRATTLPLVVANPVAGQGQAATLISLVAVPQLMLAQAEAARLIYLEMAALVLPLQVVLPTTTVLVAVVVIPIRLALLDYLALEVLLVLIRVQVRQRQHLAFPQQAKV
jgi:hypothetical protein